MEMLVMISQLLLGLMILVGIHEAGHMWMAKLFGMRVEKFSIGFPPKIFSFKIGETEYSFGAMPFGGFVKITGMVDESMDLKSVQDEPKPYEFRAKPTWQRLLVMLGGIMMNVVLGVTVFIFINFIFGKTFIPKEELKYGIQAYPLAQNIGLKNGDFITKINGKDYDSFTDIFDPEILLGTNSYYTVKRGNETLEVKIPSSILDSLADENPFISIAFPFTVGAIVEKSNAEKGGLQVGDSIISVNNKPVVYFHDIQEVLGELKNQKADFIVARNNTFDTLKIEVNEEGKVGFAPKSSMTINPDTTFYSFGESISIGTKEAFNVLIVQYKAFGKIFKGEISASKSVSGPIGMAKQFSGTFEAHRFWYLVGLLSMVLAFMNLLPIPALDGGHVVFLLYEMITGRKPSLKFMEYSIKIGIAILLSLMVFAFGNDLFKLFK